MTALPSLQHGPGHKAIHQTPAVSCQVIRIFVAVVRLSLIPKLAAEKTFGISKG
jgi:hypothetical protein